jgi:hypothetical protein
VSEELKAANKALIERCKALLSEAGFKDFREQSGAFMHGGVSAGGGWLVLCTATTSFSE